MAYPLEVREQITVGGKVSTSRTLVTADGLIAKERTVGPAKTGQLTTRTDANTGVLTMTNGHGIPTGRIDVYWSGGSRRGMSGTVTVNSIAIDGGSGDDLPPNSTAITAMAPIEEPLVIAGDEVLAIEMYSEALGLIVLADDEDAELLFKNLGGADASAYRSYVWTPDRNATSPLAGVDVAKVFFSHGDSTRTVPMRVQLPYS